MATYLEEEVSSIMNSPFRARSDFATPARISFSNGSYAPLHTHRRQAGNFAFLTTTDSQADLLFGPVPVSPLPPFDLLHHRTPSEFIIAGQGGRANRSSFRGSFGAEAWALGGLLGRLAGDSRRYRDVVFSDCAAALAVASGIARSRHTDFSATLRHLCLASRATLMYCPSHLEMPVNFHLTPQAWGNTIVDAAAAIDVGSSIVYLAVTLESSTWSTFRFDPSLFVYSDPITGQMASILQGQAEDDEDSEFSPQGSTSS
jgi:hypothetical protein